MTKSFASRLPKGMDINDLYDYGCIGLMEAWERYDPKRGVKFITYAYRRIRGAMLTAINQHQGMRPYRTKSKEKKPEIVHYGLNADNISKEVK